MDKNQNQYCDDPYPNASCPCPSLPEGMVVVKESEITHVARELERMGSYSSAPNSLAKILWDALEKKP